MKAFSGTDDTSDARRGLMGALALASGKLLAERYATIEAEVPPAIAVRGPEVGLVMLRGRTGGSGAPFNLGEASVTRATVKLESGEVGHALVLGRDTRKARIAAHLDALWQRPEWRDRIDRDVVEPVRADRAETARAMAEETEATRVDFFTVVRGED
jgi:alpha-D-ribose 1-methylphosphonate 5-triphosphate synthase subunit PhnG